MTRRIPSLVAVALALSLCAVGCESPNSDSGTTSKAMEQRMREIEKRMKDSMPKTQQIALAQKPDPAVVRKVQDQLVDPWRQRGEELLVRRLPF